MSKYVFDGLGIIPAIDVVVEQLKTVICQECGAEFSITRAMFSDPGGYDSRCDKCSARWFPPGFSGEVWEQGDTCYYREAHHEQPTQLATRPSHAAERLERMGQ